MSQKLVSVIMPAYNAEHFLAEAVESILNQTYTDFEFLIVNDGSKDGSGRILDQYASRDPRVRLWHRENAGYISALNFMLGQVRGDLIFRMDADDVSLPERFEKQIAFMEHNGDCVGVGMAAQIIDPDGRDLRVMVPPANHEEIDGMGLRGLGAAIFHPTLLMRRDAAEKVGGYREEYPSADDVDIFLRLAEVGRLANLQEIGLKYRLHPNSVGYTRRAEQAASARKAAIDASRRRGLPEPTWDRDKVVADRDPFQTVCMWAWWALRDGHRSTARHYATQALKMRPASPSAWKLLACSLRGR